MPEDFFDGVQERRLERPDGRVVAWVEWGPPEGIPVLRVPGTPGSRHTLRADRAGWAERGLRILQTERPGYGASSRLPGRRFDEHSDDLAAVLDAADVDSAFVIGGSGSAPHELSFAGRHPERVRAMTICVGAAPVTDDEAQQMIGLNRQGRELARAGKVDELRDLLTQVRESILADPLAGFRGIMDTAPAADVAVMQDPLWQQGFVAGLTEALRPGVDGWLDESIAILNHYDDIDLGAVRTSVTWWHGAADANAPVSAARRLVDQLPNARFVLFGEDAGHFAPYSREPEILDELLARG